jgi:hypothetical protein
LGKYSGEMYTMQNHIWLAGDQESVLRTGFFGGDGTLRNDRWRDLVVLTPVYLVACWVVGDATGVIANWFLEEEKDEGKEEGRHVAGTGAGSERRKQRSHARAASTSSAVEMGLLLAGGASSSSSSSSDEDTYISEKYEPRQSSPGLLYRVKRVWPGTVWGRAVLTLAVLWAMNLVSLLKNPHDVYCVRAC